MTEFEFRQGGQVGRNIYCGPRPEDEIAVAIGALPEATEWAARIVRALKLTHGPTVTHATLVQSVSAIIQRDEVGDLSYGQTARRIVDLLRPDLTPTGGAA